MKHELRKTSAPIERSEHRSYEIHRLEIGSNSEELEIRMNMDTKLVKSEFLSLKAEVDELIRQVDTTKQTHLQNYLHINYYPLFSFAESIFILFESGKHHAAKVLLRSLIDAHINIIYHQLKDSERRLAISVKSGFDKKIRNIKAIKALIERYPDLESKDPTKLYSKEWLGKADQWTERERLAILRGNNLTGSEKDIKLIEKTKKCDEEGGFANKWHFEQMYHVIYRQLSPVSHLDIEGIQAFVSKDELGKYLFSDEDNPDLLISTAVGICLALTKDLYENNIIGNGVANAVLRIEKLIE